MKISVIVPVYNAGEYIDKCIDSISQQSYSNWELILVDDGSSDQSGYICDKWADSDIRIKVFHQANKGVSSARNLGILQATGEIITFVDADDWLDNNTLAEVLVFIDSFDFVRTSMNYCFKEFVLPYHVDETESWYDLMLQILSRKTILGVCSAFYKTNLIKQHQIVFNEKISNGEDWLFTCQYLKAVEKVKTIDKAFYQYNKQNEDSCTNNMSFEKSKESYNVANSMRSLFQEDKRLINSLNAGLYSILLSSLHDCFRADSFKEARMKTIQVKQQMSDIHLNFILNRNLSLSQKIHLLLFRSYAGQLLFWNYLSFNGLHKTRN